jgi:ribonucleoside-diphosphate reductase alpha chain
MKYKDFYWLNEDSRTFLKRGVIDEDPIERIEEVSKNFESIVGIKGIGEKYFEYCKRGFYTLSTPVWSNYGKTSGYPVSCFGSVPEDSIESMLYKNAEIGMMSKGGGGTSICLDNIRPRGSQISFGGKSDGPVRFLELYEKTTEIVSQGKSRRGTLAAYLSVDHPDIMDFLSMRGLGHPIQDLNFAVTLTNEWLDELKKGDKKRREIWSKIVQKKFETGYPYITNLSNANNSAPIWYKEGGYKIIASNVCNEIFLPSTPAESFVCVLSSLNLLHWDEIVKTDAIETMIMFLYSVNEEFIQKSESDFFMRHANNFAKKHKALGMGVAGWHSLLQSKMIPFESMEAKFLNNEVFKTIKTRSDDTNRKIASIFGECEVTKGYGVGCSTLTAIAPTTSSSFLLGQVSQGIEPVFGNSCVKDLAKGRYAYKNPILEELLESKNKNSKEIWKSINDDNGSVQNMEFLSQKEKDVFKTFEEISQMEIVTQAAQRQQYIDQGQSLNIKVPSSSSAKLVSQLYLKGFEMGIKGFYYQRGTNPNAELKLNCPSCES